MFKHAATALQRHKDKPPRSIKFKRVLKNINNPDEKLKATILYHSFFNKYANHPIPIKVLTDKNAKEANKLSMLDEINQENSLNSKNNLLILSLIQNELPLAKLFGNNSSEPAYKLDNSLFDIFKKAKRNKDKNIVEHAKLKPFTQDSKLDKAKFLEEFQRLQKIKKANENKYNNIYTFHPDNLEVVEELPKKDKDVENESKDIKRHVTEDEESDPASAIKNLAYKNLGPTRRAAIAMKRYSKKHNLNMDDKAIAENLKSMWKLDFPNDYFKVGGKDILIPKNNVSKDGIVLCWELKK